MCVLLVLGIRRQDYQDDQTVISSATVARRSWQIQGIAKIDQEPAGGGAATAALEDTMHDSYPGGEVLDASELFYDHDDSGGVTAESALRILQFFFEVADTDGATYSELDDGTALDLPPFSH